MSLTVIGAAANVFGVITPAKDLGEIIKGIADTVQEVKLNDESTSYWDKTLKDHARDVYTFMIRCNLKEAGANDLQSHSLTKLLESLIILRKEIIECSRQPYLSKLWASGNIRRKIEGVERKMKHCQDLFVADTLSTHTGMLLRVDKSVREIVDREGSSHVVKSTAIRWKVPGKAESSGPMVMEYAYLAVKSHTLIYELKSNTGYIQERLLHTGHDIENLGSVNVYYPAGSPLSDCEDTSSKIIRACQMLRSRNFDDASFIKWLIDSEELSDSLHDVGLTKEARQFDVFMCQLWSFLASSRGTAPIYSRLATSLRGLAVEYSNEGRHVEALSHVEQAIQIHRSLGESSLPQLAKCLSHRSHYLRFLGRFEESLASAKDSVGIWRRLVDDLSLYGLNLVDSLESQAQALLRLSQHEETLRCSHEAIQWLSKLTPRYKQVHSVEYARISWIIAVSHHNFGNHEQAREYGRRALSVTHVLIRDRPLYYSHTLSYTLDYSSWFDQESALSVLDESMTACLTVDTTFTIPQLADILDRRAAALVSSARYKEALDSYNQAIDIRRRLLEDEDNVDSKHFKGLLQSFRFRSSCLFFLHRQRDALSSLDAAQDAIVSRLRSEISEDLKDIFIEELKEQHKLLGDPTGPDCVELVSSLKSCKKMLSQIREVKCASRISNSPRSDFGILSTLEYEIYIILRKEELALLATQDAIDFYRSQIERSEGQRNRANLVTTLVLHARCCSKMDRLERALHSINDAMVYLLVDLNNNVEDSMSHIFQIFDIYCGISKYLIEERGYHRELRLFLDAGISILQNPAMASHAQRNQILACLLNDGAYLLYEVGSYKDALSASDESVAIYRILAAEDAEEHESNLVMSLYRLGRSQLVTGEANAAWTSAEEGIDLCIEREDPQCISGLLRNLLLLRGDIQFDLGRVPGVHDVLLESLLLEIAPDRDIDLNFNYGYNLPKPDVANNSRFGEDDESESESVYMSALDGAESGDF